MRVYYYKTINGDEPCHRWLRSIPDDRLRSIIRKPLRRVELGNIGDSRSISHGVFELRIHEGPGFRIYFGRSSADEIILLLGGQKKSQRSDILKSQFYWEDHRRRYK